MAAAWRSLSEESGQPVGLTQVYLRDDVGVAQRKRVEIQMSVDKRILLVVGFLVIMVGACNQLEPPVTVEPPWLSPTRLECTENPPGLELQVDSLGNRRVRVRGEGFQPREELSWSSVRRSTRPLNRRNSVTRYVRHSLSVKTALSPGKRQCSPWMAIRRGIWPSFMPRESPVSTLSLLDLPRSGIGGCVWRKGKTERWTKRFIAGWPGSWMP
jgi:hypothetical protein